MIHSTTLKKLRLLQNGLAAGIALLAAAHGLRAQDTILVNCDSAAVPSTYCYVDNDDHSWYWHNTCPGYPVVLQFTSGDIAANDQLVMYDGSNPSAPILFMTTMYSDLDLTGALFASTGTDIYMELISDSVNCCATTGFVGTEWHWTASDGSSSAGINEAQAGNFTMYPNPAVNELSLRLTSNTNGPAEIRILDVSGRVVYQKSFTANGGALNTFDLHGLQSGNYSVVLTTPNWVKAESLQVIR